jgi:hypothetical protein
MDMTMSELNGVDSAGLRISILRKKIVWLCQSVRVMAAAYAIWVLYLLTDYWSDVEAINNGYGRALHRDLSGLEPWQQGAAFAVNFGIWLFAAAACYSAWRLFSVYIEGKIFTLESATWLQRLALFGVIAQALGVVTRPLMSVILTLHFPAGQQQRIVSIFFQPDDLAILLLLLGLLALAHIQKTAAEIAGEHAQFV